MGLKSILGGSKSNDSPKKRAPLRNESLREDPADEGKRVARRRLIGSVALLMAAIIVLPLVLEDAPKPVSADLALQIPSRDLAVRSDPEASPPKDPVGSGADASTRKSADSRVPEPKSDAKPVAKADVKPDSKAEAKADTKLVEQKTEPRSDAKPVSLPEVKPEVKTDPKLAAKLEPKTDVKAEPKAEPKLAARPAEPKAGKQLPVVQGDDPIAGFANAKTSAANTAPPGASATASTALPSAPASGAAASASTSDTKTASVSSGRSNHWVQIGAFGNEAKAREMASQLRGKGYPAVTEVVRGGNSELYRVRVGPLETRESANRARDNLARSGFEGSVVQ